MMEVEVRWGESEGEEEAVEHWENRRKLERKKMISF